MLQYHHDLDRGFTVAVSTPSKETLVSLAEVLSDKKIELPIGISVCSPKDQFSKAIGRDVASKRMTMIMFNLEHLIFQGNRIVYVLTNPAEKLIVYLTIHNKSPFVYFIETKWG